jgi:hypothetical protein
MKPPTLMYHRLRSLHVEFEPVAATADCLKDLQRFLREDDIRTRDAFCTLGRTKLARTDLVPLITTYAADTDIVYNACTHPAPLVQFPHLLHKC